MNIGRVKSVMPILAGVVVLAVGTFDCREYFAKAFADWERGWVEGVKGDGIFVDAVRILVRRHVGKSEIVGLVTASDGTFSSMDRTLTEALDWELTPRRVRLGSEVTKCTAVVIGPTRNCEEIHHKLTTAGFTCSGKISGAELWRRDDVGAFTKEEHPRLSLWQDVVAMVTITFMLMTAWFSGGLFRTGMVIVFVSFASLLLVLTKIGTLMRCLIVWAVVVGITLSNLVMIRRTGFGRVSVLEICGVLFLFAMYACLALVSDLPTNCGLGVWGGKARLWWTGTEGLFLGAESSCSVLQPSYPPIFPSLIWFFFSLAGGVSEWGVQILPALFVALVAVSLASRCTNQAFAFLVFSLFVCEPMFKITVYFYAEPLLILLALAGLEAIDRKFYVMGLFMIGCCGAVKLEGLPMAVLLTLAIFGFRGVPQWMELRSSMGLAAFALLGPGLGWMFISRIVGCMPQDFAPLWAPDGVRALVAMKKVGHLVLWYPWRYAFAYQVAAFFPFAVSRSLRSFLPLVFLLCSDLTFVFVFSLSRTPDFVWHCRSLERLLLPPAFLTLAMLLRQIHLDERRERCYGQNDRGFHFSISLSRIPKFFAHVDG